MIPLPTQRIQHLDTRAPERRWLIEELWADEAVGIVGGEPKCGKSFLALQIAVAVASATPCLGRFTTHRSGRVLVYAAEDPTHLVRERVEGICQLTGASFDTLDLHLVTRETLRIDLPDDQRALAQTIANLRPALLVLDPFVRLHRADENASGEIAPILAELRSLQREHALAILVVHHAKKAAARLRAGQALRGSSEFHAWGDSNLYLRRDRERIRLSVEHRAAHSAIDDLELALRHDTKGTGLVINDDRPPAALSSHDERSVATVDTRIVETLKSASRPLGRTELRTAARLRNQVCGKRLAVLVRDGVVIKTDEGYRIARREQPSDVPVPESPRERTGTGTGTNAATTK